MTSRPAQSHMLAALAEAEAAAARGEVPVGAVVVAADGAVLARAGNRTRELADPTAHAEMLAIRQACARAGSERLDGADLYVTLGALPDVRGGDLVRPHPPALLRRRRPQGRRRGARAPHLQPADLPPRA